MQRLILLLLSVIVLGCSTTPRNLQSWMEMEKNACLPTAIAFREGLKKYQVWSEVVVYQYQDANTQKVSGHAIVAYLYPPGKNQLWTYDYLGSYKTRAYKDNPLDIATKAVQARGQWNYIVKSAEYID